MWWSPEEANGKEEDTSPFGIHPRWSPPQTLGALQTGWRWGQGEQGQSAGTGPCSAWSWLGEGAFLEEAPSLEISSEQGEENPREGNHGYSLLESLFGVISQQQQIMDCRNKKGIAVSLSTLWKPQLLRAERMPLNFLYQPRLQATPPVSDIGRALSPRPFTSSPVTPIPPP